MIGRTLEAYRPLPVGTLLWGLLGLLWLAGAVIERNLHLALAGLLPLALAVAVYPWRVPRRWTGTFYEDALEVDEDGARHSIEYERMQILLGVKRPYAAAQPGPRRYPIYVVYEGGQTVIPHDAGDESDEVYRFLSARLTASGSRAVPATLQDYVRRTAATFGEEKVATFVRRERLPRVASRLVRIAAALLATGVAWLVGGALLNLLVAVGRRREEFDGWMVGGLLLSIASLLTLVFLGVRGGRAAGPHRRIKQAGLVISPLGIALVQGTLAGEMAWDELRDVQLLDRHRRRLRLELAHGWYGVRLALDGAEVLIADIYDRPPTVIFECIWQLWKPAAAPSPPEPTPVRRRD